VTDGADRIRGFPAFPPGRRARQTRAWWGDAWIRALEETSLDQTLLRRGRRSASAGQVGSITVSPGRIAAEVHDGVQDVFYRSRVFVEPMTDAEWTRFLDQVEAKAGHIAALLDGEMPRDLVAAAADVGVRLLPGLGDLQPECDCPEWGDPCPHATALCYQVAWLLDADPFVLLLIRGRGRRELLAELRRRTARPRPGPPTGPSAGTGGVPAAQAYARPDPVLPQPPPPPGSDGLGPELPDAPGVPAEALRALVDNAADRAAALLGFTAPGGAPPPSLPERSDAVRLAAAGASGPALARLRRASGRPAREFSRAVRAWEYGGPAGLAVLEESWRPPASGLARARARLDAGWDGDDLPQPQVWRNRWTFPDRRAQLRYGQDGRWYPYREAADGEWWPAGAPRDDPAEALADLLGG
jgi:uncharacterized Zn finger protein